MDVTFRAIAEATPGAKWKEQFERHWAGYRAWFVRSGMVDRPSYLECRRALRQYMPELVPTWQSLVELAGGGDLEARFLSMWCPPKYIGGCSQAVWIDPQGDAEPGLVRNYDYAPALLEGSWLRSRWREQAVLAMSDCLWGALDGVNEAGLAASLSFGGRSVAGSGFGVPLVLRHVLEVAQSTAEAIGLLERIPISMSYNITLLDRRGHWRTVYLAPDRAAEVTNVRACTNLQRHVEWPLYARATRSVERLDSLEHGVETAPSVRALEQRLLEPPLFQTSWGRGYGTLYTASYLPCSRSARLAWRDAGMDQRLDAFCEGEHRVAFELAPPAAGSAP